MPPGKAVAPDPPAHEVEMVTAEEPTDGGVGDRELLAALRIDEH
jgi:hypothetical protein